MNIPVDPYPSRGNHPSLALPRQDPVVWLKESARSPLNEEQSGFYENNGFLVLESVLSEAEVAAYNDELNRLRQDSALREREEVITEPGSREVRSIFRIHRISSVFTELAADPRLAGVARYLLDDEVYLHQSRLNYKPGFKGKEFYWHSDFETWHMEDGMPRMRALSISVVLTGNTIYNGALMLIPGSHREYISCPGETPEHHYLSSLKQQEYGVPDQAHLTRLVSQQGIHLASCPAGSLVIFDCNTLHGSASNISPYPRSNAFFVYNAVSNRLGSPYTGQAPRPEYIASREDTEILAL